MTSSNFQTVGIIGKRGDPEVVRVTQEDIL